MSGQSSTITGTLSGQIIMEGMVEWRVYPPFRRLITRVLAILPAIITILAMGDAGVNYLLILSQVALSYALPFAMFPLAYVTSDSKKMGVHVNRWFIMVLAYGLGLLILALNIIVLIQYFSA